MTVLGHSITWGTHAGAGRVTETKSGYTPFKTWWADHKAARQAAKRVALEAQWDAQREAVCTPGAGAACDMVAMALRDFGV